MRILEVSVSSFEATLERFAQVWETGRGDPTPRHSFVSWNLLHKVLAPNRMSILMAMRGAGPMSIREVARRVERDFKGVHSDIKALILSGLVDKTEDRMVIFPYDDIHIDYRASSAA